jgi:methionine-rich copper-binding protein CopC
MITAVFAHAEPAQVKPGLGANVATAPSQVEIVMTQEMARRAGGNDIDVLDASGNEVTTIAAVIDNGDRRKLSVPLPSELPPGKYSVKWKTISADDGDPAEGEYVFTYDPSKPADPGRENLTEAAVTPGAGGDGETDNGQQAAPGFGSGGDSGVSWVLVAAVGVAGLTIGSGATFLLVQRRP